MRYSLRLSLICMLVVVGLTACSDEPTPDVLGCTDPSSSNYNPDATKDDGSCTDEILGCTDPNSFNYNSDATKDDGSCVAKVLGCTDPDAFNYNPDANTDDGSCIAKVLGCMDPNAFNYNPDANVDDGSCAYDGVDGSVTELPAAFKQKVLIEYFTGNWCGYCPDGQILLEDFDTKFPTDVVILQAHTKDAMMIPEYRAYMKFELGGEFAPGATVNRKPSSSSGEVYMHTYEWEANINNILTEKTNSIGLAIETSISGDELSVTTHVGFLNEQSEAYKLFVIVLEDSVIGSGDEYDQANYYNNDAGHPYYNLGNPIVGYPHRRVVRAYAHDVDGEAIPAEEVKANHVYVKTNTFNIAAYRKEYVSVVAFVVESRGTPIDSPVINVQTVKAGQIKNWN